MVYGFGEKFQPSRRRMEGNVCLGPETSENSRAFDSQVGPEFLFPGLRRQTAQFGNGSLRLIGQGSPPSISSTGIASRKLPHSL